MDFDREMKTNMHWEKITAVICSRKYIDNNYLFRFCCLPPYKKCSEKWKGIFLLNKIFTTIHCRFVFTYILFEN